MKSSESKGFMKEAAIGCVIVAAILLLGTVITDRNASEDTEAAVHAVSMMYLDELAARRGQVVSPRPSTIGRASCASSSKSRTDIC